MTHRKNSCLTTELIISSLSVVFFPSKDFMANAFVSCVLVVVDFCAKMAKGHAQKGAETKTSAGQTCYAISCSAVVKNTKVEAVM